MSDTALVYALKSWRFPLEAQPLNDQYIRESTNHVARLLSVQLTTCQPVSIRGFSNIPGQYITNIPAQHTCTPQH